MSITRVPIRFKLLAPRPTTVIAVQMTFALEPPAATIFAWGFGEAWEAVPQRTWVNGGWSPAL